MLTNKAKSSISVFYGFVIFIFFAGLYIVPEKIKIWTIILIGGTLFCLLFSRVKIVFNMDTLLWIIYILIGFIVGMLNNSVLMIENIEFVIQLVIGIYLGSIYINSSVTNKQLKSIYYITILVVFGCVLQMVMPDVLVSINRVTLGEDKFKIFYEEFFQYNFLVGFSYQTGITGYYLAILEGFIVCYYFSNTNRLSLVKKIGLLFIFAIIYIMLLQTGKRGEMLIVIIISFLIMCYFERKKPLKIFIIVCFALILLTILLFFTEMGQRLIERTFGDNPTSSRDKIYSQVIQLGLDKPIFGNGFGSIIANIENFRNGHNIYLQTFAETGIIGLLCLLMILAYQLNRAFVALKINQMLNENNFVVLVCMFIELNFIFTGMIGNPLYDVYPLFGYFIATGGINSELIKIKNRGEYERSLFIKKDI